MWKEKGTQSTMNTRLEELQGANSASVEEDGVLEHYRERKRVESIEYRRKRYCIILLQSRSRWRKTKLQRKLCSAVWNRVRSVSSDRKKEQVEGEAEREERDANPYFYYYVMSVVSV